MSEFDLHINYAKLIATTRAKKYGDINIAFGNNVESLYIIIITMMFTSLCERRFFNYFLKLTGNSEKENRGKKIIFFSSGFFKKKGLKKIYFDHKTS